MKWPNSLKKELLLEKEKLLSFVEELSKYYNKETIDMLISVIMLETSVFEHKDFYEEFGSLDSFFEIAKYNICNHTIKILREKLEFDSEKLKIGYGDTDFTILYKAASYFNILYCDFKRKENNYAEKFLKPSIVLPYYEMGSQEKIEQISEEIQQLKAKEYNNGEYYGGRISTYGGSDSYQRFQDLKRVQSLENELENLIENGALWDEKNKICNQVTEFLIKEWQLDNWNSSNRLDKKNSKVKRLSWIDVYKG